VRSEEFDLTNDGYFGGRWIPDANLQTLWADLAPKLTMLGITRVANVTGLDRIGVPVAMAVRPLSRSMTVAQGKGLTLAAAKISAVMEAAESFHAERIQLPVRLGSPRELLRSSMVVDLSRLCRSRHTPLDVDEPVVWIQAESIVTGAQVLVPIECVHTAFTPGMAHHLGRFFNSTAGLGAGANYPQAILQGLYEVVERDAALLSSLESSSQQDRRRLDVSSVVSPECCFLLSRLSAQGARVGLWDLTQDTGISVYRCVIVDEENKHGRRICAAGGLGCDLFPAVALRKAMLEAIQTRLTVITGSRDDLFRERYSSGLEPAHLAAHRMLVAGNGECRMRMHPDDVSPNPHFQISTVIDRLKRVGLDEVLVVRLGQPDIGIPVARVIVPGLEIYDSLEDCLPGLRARSKLCVP
jgi:YcaO-like protein with predicted kinase domain